MAVIERVYTIPFSDAYHVNRKHRTIRAVKVLKAFLARHMKVSLENVKIDAGLNDEMWSHGMTKPPHKVKVKVIKGDDGVVAASLLGDELKPKQKEVKEVKAEKKPKAKREKEVKKEKSKE